MARGKYDVNNLRKEIKKNSDGKFKDPYEFKPPQVKDGEVIKYRFFVLPPLDAGEKTVDGVASKSMGNLFYVRNGSHWYNNRSYSCPRVHDDDDCPLCQLAFSLMSETDDKAKRSDIAKTMLPRTKYAANVYFPKDGVNPDDIAGKVLWMNASKQIFDKWEACIMNDDEGDPADPQPYGVFFDEYDAYLFQLTVRKKNQWNDYSESKFLSSLGRVPLAQNKDKKPIESRIEEILSQRHDLFTKFTAADPEALRKIVEQITNGEVVEDSAGFDEDEESKPEPKPVKKVESKKIETNVEAEEDTEEIVSEEAPFEDVADEPAPKASKKKPVVDDDEDSELQDLLSEIGAD